MQADKISLNDWHRVLIGNVPVSFFVEALLRTAIVYLILMISMRLLGKRMAGQLSKNEMISLTTLAAAVGIPIQAPERGILPAFIIAVIVVVTGRGISSWSARNQKFESLSQDKLSMLVKDSVLQMDNLRETKITRERLFSYLRSQSIVHLGQVKRTYLEAGGYFTCIRNDEPCPGLSVLPVWDIDFIKQQSFTNEMVCTNCGQKIQSSGKCPDCGSNKAESAMA